MATFTFQFTVADEHMGRISYALRKQFGPAYDTVVTEVHDPELGTTSRITNQVPREMTSAEVLERVRQLSIDNIKGIVLAVEVNDAAQKARDSVTSVVVE
jgi:hypothetical protein